MSSSIVSWIMYSSYCKINPFKVIQDLFCENGRLTDNPLHITKEFCVQNSEFCVQEEKNK